MSGIYILGMEMPTSCFDCPFREINPDDYACMALNKEFEETFSLIAGHRHKDCPLIPVPDHGRLIDADALWVKINKICDRRDAGIISDLTCLQQLLSAVRHAPTIIPADKEVDHGEKV